MSSSVFIIPRRSSFVKGSTFKKLDKIRQGLYTVPWKAAFASRVLFKLHMSNTAGGWSPFPFVLSVFLNTEMNHGKGVLHHGILLPDGTFDAHRP